MTLKRTLIAGLAILSLALPAATTILVATSPAPAFAKDGKGQSNGKGGSGGNSATRGNSGKTKTNGSNGNGAVRSNLGSANASNASATALEHASDNSRVGQARIFRDSYLVAQTAAANLGTEAQTIYGGYGTTPPDYTSADKQAEIDGLAVPDPAGDYGAGFEFASYDDAMAAYARTVATLEAERDAAAAYEAQAYADSTLLALTGGRELSDDAMTELLANLGL